MIVTVQEGVPIVYPGCYGNAARGASGQPHARQEPGLVMFYLAPHVVLTPASTKPRKLTSSWKAGGISRQLQGEVKKGATSFTRRIHGIENTGTETLVVLIATSPPNP